MTVKIRGIKSAGAGALALELIGAGESGGQGTADAGAHEHTARSASSAQPMPASVMNPARAEHWLCVRFPCLALEVHTLCVPASEPCVVAAGAERNQMVIACDARAQALGVVAGMKLSAAYAFGDFCVRMRDADAERAALERLAACAYQYSSRVCIKAVDALVLEVRGSLKLFGGLRSLCARIEADIDALGYTLTAASAPTPMAALLAARTGQRVHVIRRARLPDALAALPLAVLELDADARARLHGIGAAVLGDLMKLPRGGLSRRFGLELLDVLDRARGCKSDPQLAYVPPARFAHRVDLANAVEGGERLLFIARRQVRELVAVLQARVGAVERFEWRLRHGTRVPTSIVITLLAPSRDPEHLFVLLAERLDRVRLPAPVSSVELLAEEFVTVAGANRDLFAQAPGQAHEQCAALIERLCARLGAEAITGLCLMPDHRPERAWAVSEIQPGPRGPRAHRDTHKALRDTHKARGKTRDIQVGPQLDGSREHIGGHTGTPIKLAAKLGAPKTENQEENQDTHVLEAPEQYSGAIEKHNKNRHMDLNRARISEPSYGLPNEDTHDINGRAHSGTSAAEVGADAQSVAVPIWQRRPLWLLAAPRPLSMVERRPYLEGELRMVSARERIESGWWDGADVARDYVVAVNPRGSVFWIYRDLSDRRWYLHGIFE